MPRRVTRVGPIARGLAPLVQSISRGQTQINRGYGNRRGASVPQGAFNRQAPLTPITGGYAATTVDAGAGAIAYVGPQGVGTVWYPQSVAINTTSGANDSSTCSLYLSPLPVGGLTVIVEPPIFQIGGQSYAGGGDTIGLSVPPLRNGYFIIAIWADGNPGDVAALQVYGNQQALTY